MHQGCQDEKSGVESVVWCAASHVVSGRGRHKASWRSKFCDGHRSDERVKLQGSRMRPDAVVEAEAAHLDAVLLEPILGRMPYQGAQIAIFHQQASSSNIDLDRRPEVAFFPESVAKGLTTEVVVA